MARTEQVVFFPYNPSKFKRKIEIPLLRNRLENLYASSLLYALSIRDKTISPKQIACVFTEKLTKCCKGLQLKLVGISNRLRWLLTKHT